jgi:hypothetical protein
MYLYSLQIKGESNKKNIYGFMAECVIKYKVYINHFYLHIFIIDLPFIYFYRVNFLRYVLSSKFYS